MAVTLEERAKCRAQRSRDRICFVLCPIVASSEQACSCMCMFVQEKARKDQRRGHSQSWLSAATKNRAAGGTESAPWSTSRTPVSGETTSAAMGESSQLRVLKQVENVPGDGSLLLTSFSFSSRAAHAKKKHEDEERTGHTKTRTYCFLPPKLQTIQPLGRQQFFRTSVCRITGKKSSKNGRRQRHPGAHLRL